MKFTKIQMKEKNILDGIKLNYFDIDKLEITEKKRKFLNRKK